MFYQDVGKNMAQMIQSDLFIPYLEVTIRLWKGHVNSPSQKGHQQTC